MILARVTAALCTFLLIALCSLGCIALLAHYGPVLAHGYDVEHVAGILQASEDTDMVVLRTSDGELWHFRCEQRCLTQRAHIARHIVEHAPTDVYYRQGPEDMLIAVDVD